MVEKAPPRPICQVEQRRARLVAGSMPEEDHSQPTQETIVVMGSPAIGSPVLVRNQAMPHSPDNLNGTIATRLASPEPSRSPAMSPPPPAAVPNPPVQNAAPTGSNLAYPGELEAKISRENPRERSRK
ncbi:unnamed protein product, partial [Mesorhabditis belari]|uniref:Uncharacterized protein n=1 Tax=Mesorhabditis belari TaxID=2138241 RepID=A0AAF3EMG8_9BILA